MSSFEFHTDRTKVLPSQVVTLLEAVGWGASESTQYAEKVRTSWEFYEVVVFAEVDHQLIGYATGYSDRSFTTGMGELIVHPAYRRQGVARCLLAVVEDEFPGVPFYIKTFAENVPFFEACGFKQQPSMVVLSKTKPGAT